MDFHKYIEKNIIRCDASYRGGGIEISLNELLEKDTDGDEDDFRMTAYQNYLGGGMLGAICHSYNFIPTELSKIDQIIIDKITEELKKYFHSLTNHSGDEWEEQTYIQNQNMPVSAY